MTEYFGLRTVLDPERIVITQSDLAAFKRDRRLWFFRTYLGLQPKYVVSSSPLVLGTLVHAALEQKYRDGVDLLTAYETAVADARAEFEASRTTPFDLPGWTKQAVLGQRMLEGFEEWLADEHIDSDIRTVAVEKLLQVETTYLGSPVVLTGKADLIVQDRISGETLIYDFKTTANLERTIRQAYTTEQLPYYMTLQQALTPDEWVTGAAFYCLLKSQRTARAKPPFYSRTKISYSKEALDTRRSGLHGAITDYVRVVQALHAGTSKPFVHAYPNPGVLQFDRSFDLLLDVIDSGGNVTSMIADRFDQRSPYARYSQTTSLLTED